MNNFEENFGPKEKGIITVEQPVLVYFLLLSL